MDNVVDISVLRVKYGEIRTIGIGNHCAHGLGSIYIMAKLQESPGEWI